MDLIDKKLLCELDLNCRNPISRIAKKLRISRNVADYRIKNLEKQGIITKYICSVNLGRFGYKTYKIYFKTQGFQKSTEETFVKHLSKSPQVLHLIKTEGTFDYSATVAVKSILELDNFLTDVKTKFKKFISGYSVSIIVYSRIFKLNKLLLEQKHEAIKFEKYSSSEKTETIDDKDKKILKCLSQSANLPIIDLAEKTNLSVDIVKYRLKSLNSLINSNRVLLDFNKMGYYHYIIMLSLKTTTKNDEEKLVSWCTLKNNVLFCTKRIGDFDFEINIAITSINNLNDFISSLKEEFDGIIDSYDLVLNSKLLKINYIPFGK